MKQVILILMLIPFICFQTQAKVGIGATLLDPTGLSINYFLEENKSIHTIIGYNLEGDDDVEIISHLTWRRGVIHPQNFPFRWFGGVGGSLVFINHDHPQGHDDEEDVELGLSGTLGVFHDFKEVPIDVFFKSNLILNLIPNTDTDLQALVGIHYNFQ